MAIQHYGLDEAEIENLKAAHLTDEEINDLNKKRVQEQMEDEKEIAKLNADDSLTQDAQAVRDMYLHIPPRDVYEKAYKEFTAATEKPNGDFKDDKDLPDGFDDLLAFWTVELHHLVNAREEYERDFGEKIPYEPIPFPKTGAEANDWNLTK